MFTIMMGLFVVMVIMMIYMGIDCCRCPYEDHTSYCCHKGVKLAAEGKIKDGPELGCL